MRDDQKQRNQLSFDDINSKWNYFHQNKSEQHYGATKYSNNVISLSASSKLAIDLMSALISSNVTRTVDHVRTVSSTGP